MMLSRRSIFFAIASGFAGSHPALAATPQLSPISGRDREISAALGSAASQGLYILPAGRTDRQEQTFALADALQKALAKAAGGDERASNLADRLGLLLAEISRDAHDGNMGISPAAAAPSYESVRAEYISKFNSAIVASAHRSELVSAARLIVSSDSKKRYVDVQNVTGVPWYVIGALHYREASLSFMGHLHNGDFLKLKTVQVPENRPPGVWPPNPWNAESAWRISAVDALQKYKNVSQWNVSRMLYTFEGFNGWGYRARPGFISPYLWNYTQYYRKGGYPRDRVWSNDYVSKQAGLVSILKTIKELAPSEVLLDLT